MEKINFENVVKSFFLGLFIGVILLFLSDEKAQLPYKAMAVLASGSIGFIVGLATEWLTAILPVRLANPRNYFFINNLIALIVTTIVLTSLMLTASGNIENKKDFIPVLLIVLGIVCIANSFDYIMYRRAQRRLKSFQSALKKEDR